MQNSVEVFVVMVHIWVPHKHFQVWRMALTWPEFSNECIQIHDDEGMLPAASLTVLGSVVLFKVYREGKDGKGLS